MRLKLVVLLVFGYGCATSQIPGTRFSTIRAPAQAGPCHLTNRTDSGDTERGIAFNYTCPPAGDYSAVFYESKLPLSKGTKAVLEYELGLFVQTIAYQKQRGFYSDYAILKEEFVKPEIGGVELLGIQFVFLANRKAAESFEGLNLFVTENGIIKLRWTVSREVMRQKLTPSFVPSFMSAFAAENTLNPLPE